MHRLLLSVLAWAGCGRVHFGAVAPEDANDNTVDGDAAAGLLIHLEMEDDPSDGVLDDSSGNGRSARCVAGVTCPVAIAGRVGNAVRFFGTRCVRVTHDAGLLTPDAYTVAAWVWLEVNVDQVLFAKPFSTSDLDAWGVVAWQVGGMLGTGTCMESIDESGTGHDTVCGPDIPRDRWLHVAIRWDGQGKTLFMDGGPVGNLQPVASSVIDSHDVLVGCDENAGSPVFFMQGRVDDFRVYNRALDNASIAALASP